VRLHQHLNLIYKPHPLQPHQHHVCVSDEIWVWYPARPSDHISHLYHTQLEGKLKRKVQL
jgi:hypothetical protein